MDSRIREALEKIEEMGTHDTLEGRSLIDGSVIPSQHIVTNYARIAREALALLTAEPEPCEDARKVAAQVSAVFGVSRPQVSGDPGNDPALDRATEGIAAYASQVADKRAEDLRALREALEPFADADCEDERYSDEDNPQLLSCEEYGKPRAEWCAVCNAKEALAATEPKP